MNNNNFNRKSKIPVGTVVNTLRVIRDIGIDEAKHHHYECQCEKCGEKSFVLQYKLKSGNVKCKRCENPALGQKIGTYIVERATDKRSSDGRSYYLCRCEKCGRTVEVNSVKFYRKKIQPCICTDLKINKTFFDQIMKG